MEKPVPGLSCVLLGPPGEVYWCLPAGTEEGGPTRGRRDLGQPPGAPHFEFCWTPRVLVCR